MDFLLRLIISAIAVLVSSYLLKGVEVDSFTTALIVSAVLAFMNSVVKPIMVLFTMPVTVISFGLFLVVINAFIILLTDKLVDGFKVHGFWWALVFSIVLSLITSVFEGIKKRDEERAE